VELPGALGAGASAHLRPLLDRSGLVLVPIDRATMSLVWSDHGYPAAGPYRDYHHHTVHHHNPWSNDGGAYEHDRALALAREHAQDFVARTLARLAGARERSPAALPGGGLVVCALDTELLGHWWYEGVDWLGAVLEESTRQGLELVRLDDALQRFEPGADGDPVSGRAATCWGDGGDLSTWSGPAVAEMAFAARAAELSVLAAGPQAGPAAVRELFALQASDWAFMVARGVAVPYARERFAHHRDALAAALRDPAPALDGLRNLAVDADPQAILAP
jgi:1,4-alpha-glucan branching enzyme